MRRNSGDYIDYPVSWDWWRHYSRYYDGVDPGPNFPEARSEDSPSDLKSEIEQLRGKCVFLETENWKLRNERPPKNTDNSKRGRPKSRGVDL